MAVYGIKDNKSLTLISDYWSQNASSADEYERFLIELDKPIKRKSSYLVIVTTGVLLKNTTIKGQTFRPELILNDTGSSRFGNTFEGNGFSVMDNDSNAKVYINQIFFVHFAMAGEDITHASFTINTDVDDYTNIKSIDSVNFKFLKLN